MENLSRGGLRDGVDEMDLARLLVVSEAVGDEDAEFVSELVAGEKAVAEGDEGNRNFSGCVVGPTNDSALFHTRMLEQHGFDFRRGYGEAFVLDHFLAAVDNTVEAFDVAR